LAAALPESVLSLEVGLVVESREEGARRVNPATGRTEQLRGGFWLAVIDFDPAPLVCAARADAVLADGVIGFVSGSARLDARARGVVNALASVLGACLRGTGLRAELGGHTDSTGSAEGNLALSRARAIAIREALVARGVPGDALSAQGYGATQPIADNETEEGRRANRRTAVRWIAKPG
jgi:OOP family OmpA-OmpF porin